MNRLFRPSSSLWLVGFRPFFMFAIISAVLYPLLWAMIFSGGFPILSRFENPLQWHAHEMFFGFGWAVLAGFLLTASKNWVKIRGLHGLPLMAVSGLWLAERIAFVTGLKGFTLFLASSLSVIFVVGYLLFTLLKHHENDTFKDNWFFVVGLPLLIAAKYLILTPAFFVNGWSMAIGFFRLAFLIMLERTTTQFMKTGFQIQLLRNPFLDLTIKILTFAAVFVSFLPRDISVGVLSVLSILITVRLLLWRPDLAFKKFGLAVMYVGHFAIALSLALEAFVKENLISFVGDIPVHTFVFLTMGSIIPAMLIRISQGHTGRPIVFTSSDRLGIAVLWLGAVFRLVATQIDPAHYQSFVAVAALCWSFCFAIIGFRILPFLVAPRVDGKIH